MTTKLILYNKALTEHLGERKLASLAENREPRRVLDEIWDADFVKSCLEAGLWKFAKRTSKLVYNPGVTPAFGHPYAFDKPTDFIRTAGMFTDEYLTQPLLGYQEEAGQWYCSLQEIYVAYISSDATYGSDLSLWPASFVDYAAAELAARAANRIGQNEGKKASLEKKAEKLKTATLSKDAIEGPTRFLPQGQWGASRRGNGSGELGRNRSSFYG